jgi:hypothetical protein
MSPEALQSGYWHAYHEFYRWGSIFQGAWTKPGWEGRLRHLAYATGWKKFEPLWDLVIRLKRVTSFLPLLETILEASDHPNPAGAEDLPKTAASLSLSEH